LGRRGIRRDGIVGHSSAALIRYILTLVVGAIRRKKELGHEHRRACRRPATRAAAAAGRPFELVTYPNTQHGFIYGGGHYNAQAYADAMQRAAAKLAQYLGR